MARFCTRENEPLRKWNGVPIYLTTILTAVFVVGLLLAAILISARSPLLNYLVFELPGNAWTPLSLITYPFIGEISFFTPFGIICFYMWSVGIETHLGRRVLAKLLVILALVPAVIGAVFWFGLGSPVGLAGNYLLTGGLIIAFATLYPNAEVFGWIPYKWFAFACLVCGSMMDLAGHRWLNLVSLWACAAAGFLYIRHALDSDYDDHVPVTTRVSGWFRKKPKLRVLPRPAPSPRPAPVHSIAEDAPDLEVDSLLDKIAKSGLASLSKAERAKLEQARQELLKKEHS